MPALPTIAPWKRDWPQVLQMEQRYGHLNVPTLIVWGERDDMLPDAMGYKLLDLLPDARLRIVSSGGHCPAGQPPPMCGPDILQFLPARRDHGPRRAPIGAAAPERAAARTPLDAVFPVRAP